MDCSPSEIAEEKKHVTLISMIKRTYMTIDIDFMERSIYDMSVRNILHKW